jgi:hypothetical protein
VKEIDMHSQQIDHARARRSRGHAVPALALAAALAGLTACGEDAPSAPVASAKRAETPSATAVTSHTPQTFFVNPVTGKDVNPGSLTQPFKTLAKALSVAIVADTVKLAAGTYSQATNGEKFTRSGQVVLVPNGVRIEGTLNSTGGNATILEGQLGTSGFDGEIALNLANSAVVTNVSVQRVAMGVRARSGQQTLTHLSLGLTQFGLLTEFGAQTTLRNSTVFVSNGASAGLVAVGHAQLTMDGGQLSGPAVCSSANVVYGTGVQARDTAQVTLKNKATLKDVSGVALELRNTAVATLTNAVVSKTNPLSCIPQPRVRMLDSASLRLRLNTVLSSSGGVAAVGIQSQTKGTLRIDTASVTGFTGAGVRAGSGKFTLVMNKASITQNLVGITAEAVTSADANITIAGSTLASNGTGIIAPFFKLRRSNVASNKWGVVLSAPFADLGQVGDPGNNLIINNLVTGVTFQSKVVCCGVWATGNTWNAFTQGADGNGHYPPGLIINGTSSLAKGTNFSLPNLNLSIQL